jgi:hypothetical protein
MDNVIDLVDKYEQQYRALLAQYDAEVDQEFGPKAGGLIRPPRCLSAHIERTTALMAEAKKELSPSLYQMLSSRIERHMFQRDVASAGRWSTIVNQLRSRLVKLEADQAACKRSDQRKHGGPQSPESLVGFRPESDADDWSPPF